MGACLGASLVSVGRFAASQSLMPPLSVTARYPWRIRAAATFELASSFGSESYTTISRSRGKGPADAPWPIRIAPGSFTVLCSYGYLSRASMRTGGAPLSRRCFSSSLLIRGTGTAVSCDRAVRALSTSAQGGSAEWNDTKGRRNNNITELVRSCSSISGVSRRVEDEVLAAVL